MRAAKNHATRHPPLVTFYASGLVLRRPVIRSPSFHWPRFLSNSVRSKRLSTFRLPPNVAAARRLRCCDINTLNRLKLLNRSLGPTRSQRKRTEHIPQPPRKSQ